MNKYNSGIQPVGTFPDIYWHDYIELELDRAHEFYAAQYDQLQQQNAELRAAKENAVQQARVWASEARTQQAIVADIYKAIGFDGGDWNGARPVIEKIVSLTFSDEAGKLLISIYRDCLEKHGLAAEADEAAEEARRQIEKPSPTLDEALDAVGFNPFKALCEPLEEQEK